MFISGSETVRDNHFRNLCEETCCMMPGHHMEIPFFDTQLTCNKCTR